MHAALTAQSMAQTAFSVKARDGKARCGILVTKNGSIETPAVLLYTRRGGPLSLTSPDMLAAVTPPVQAVQINTMHFLEHPDASIVREQGQGAHGFLCLGGYPILASNRDPTMYEYGVRPCTDKEVHVSIHSGGHTVSPERYMEIVAALKPDMYVTLCDEVAADAKAKRIVTSVNRTTAWLDACLQLQRHYEVHQQGPAVDAAGGDERKQQKQQKQQKKGKQGKAGQAADPAQASAGQAGTGNGGASEPEAQPQQEEAAALEAPADEAASGPPDGISRAHVEGPGAGRAAGAAAAAAAGGGGGGGGGPLAGALVLAALAGGSLPAERARAAAAVASKDGVGGYALCGLGTGEAPEQRPALIAASLGGLPDEELQRRPVFASGLVASPDELLDAVAAGVDLMDCAFVAQVTAGGYALSFPLRPPRDWRDSTGSDPSPAGDAATATAAPQAASTAAAAAFGSRSAAAPGQGPDVTVGTDDTKINLWSTAYRLDKGPLLPGCGCFACRRHSRAYLHHLLNTHEMLADVLLEAHNTSHLQAFCQSIREAIAEGRFQAFRSWFRSLRSQPLVAAPSRQTAKRRASDSGPAAEVVDGVEAAVVEPPAPAVDAAGARVGREDRQAKWVRV